MTVTVTSFAQWHNERVDAWHEKHGYNEMLIFAGPPDSGPSDYFDATVGEIMALCVWTRGDFLAAVGPFVRAFRKEFDDLR